MKKTIDKIAIGIHVLWILLMQACTDLPHSSLEDSKFVQTKAVNYKGEISSTGVIYQFRFYNNPYGLSEIDSIYIFLNKYLVLNKSYQESNDVIIDTNLIGKMIMPAVFIKSKENYYWFLKSDFSFYINKQETSDKRVLNLVFTPDSYTKDPYVIFDGFTQ